MASNKNQSALDIWKEKLEKYQRDLAITADPPKNFNWKKTLKNVGKK